MSIKRIRKELDELWTDPPAFCRLGASPVTDPYHFEVIIDGPAGSPYAGGTFLLNVVIPKKYPFKPPKFTFKTKVRTYQRVPSASSSSGKRLIDGTALDYLWS
jgi:ubiquitin-conjugating enzyme E2 D/E